MGQVVPDEGRLRRSRMPNWNMPTRKMPRPPGKNPFRVKGHGLRARMAVYDATVTGGSAAVIEAIDDPEVRAYLGGTILAASWYDLFAHAYLDIAAAGVRKMPVTESLARASALQARADASGIYSLLLKVVSPHMLVRKLGKISAQYFDHGRLDVERIDARAARMTQSGIANQLYWWWGGILDGYVTALFDIAGARNLEVQRGALKTEAPDDPLGVGRFTVDIRWE
jgi:hypothetical protein